MPAFKHSAVSFRTPDVPPPKAGRSIGPISLHNAIAVVCWSRICGLGPLEIGLLDSHKYALIQPQVKLSQIAIGPFLRDQQTTDSAPFLKGGKHKLVAEPPTGEGVEDVPKLLCARAPEDVEEERKIRKLAGSRHAPGDWIIRARIVSLSWQGLRTAKIAEKLGCHPKTVRTRIHRFNTEGIDGLGDRPGAGRKPRITQEERSRIIALVSKEPPGRLLRYDGLPPEALDETKAAYWTLDALAEAAQEMGIEVGRSQIRRILLLEGVRWRNTRPWAESTDPEFVPKGRK
jgi:transposase